MSLRLPPVELRGKKVLLQPFTAANITDAYIGWLNDPQVVRFSNQRFSRHDRASCERYVAGFAGSPHHFLGIRRADTGEAIGTMTAYVAPHHGTVDMGIMVGAPSSWGRGIGQDAWDTLASWCLAQPGMRKITAGALDCNTGMVRVMERSGMQLEAVRRAQELVDGKPHDILYYARFAGR